MNTPTSEPAQPIKLPNTPPSADQYDETSETIEVKRSTIYYFITAIMFFIAGYIVAWAVFSATTGALVNDVQRAAAVGASQAIATSVAGLNLNGVAVVEPTETLVPKQVIDVGDSPSWGPADAKVTVVEFGDFQCPYCESFYKDTYKLLKQKYGDKIRFVFKDMPLPYHPDALPAALAAQCANEQGKFWDYHDVLYSNQQDLSRQALIKYAGDVGLDNTKFMDCVTSEKYRSTIKQNQDYGASKFVGGTPTFFVNGNFVKGARSFDNFSQIIDYFLQNS